MELLYVECFELRIKGFEVGDLAVADGGECPSVGRHEFAGDLDDLVGGDALDHVWDFFVVFDLAVSEVIAGVKFADLGDGLGAHLVATESVRFGNFDVGGVDVTCEDFLDFFSDDLEELRRDGVVYFASEIPSTLREAISCIRESTVNKAFFASLTKDARIHGACEDMVEARHGVIFGVSEAAREDGRPAEREVTGVFSADESWAGFLVDVSRHIEKLA